MSDKWYRLFENKGARAAEIMLYDQIGRRTDGTGIAAKDFISDLTALQVDKITLSINSPGGNVFDGNAIYNALRTHRARIHVKIDGIAASIASVIAMAGDTVEMPENSMMMIHKPWSCSVGNSDDMRKTADALDKVQVGLVAAYRNKTKLENGEIEKLLADETWMTAAEAKAMGFCDVVTEQALFQASFDTLKQYRNVPAVLLMKNQIFTRSTMKTETETLETRCRAEFDRSADIRNEFFTFETYLAFMQASEAGAVKILKNQVIKGGE